MAAQRPSTGSRSTSAAAPTTRPCTRSVLVGRTPQSRPRSTPPPRAAPRPGRRLPRHARSEQPEGQPARCLLREPDPHDRRQAAGCRPGRLPGQPFVPGSIIDGGAFGGDSAGVRRLVRQDRQPRPGTATRTSTTAPSCRSSPRRRTSFGSTYKASIDGFDLRGGDQQGFPNNLNEIGGGTTGLPANVITQGGAVFANAYARNLQITNNVVENNGGGYGTIRIGTPDLRRPEPQRERSDRQQPDHRQRRHQPRRVRSACSTVPTATRSPTTTSAATSRPSTAAASRPSA